MFQTPGGGFVNHDFRNRVMSIPNICPIVLLGEGVFHQFHDGISTNVGSQQLEETLNALREKFRKIRGFDYECKKSPSVTYLGKMSDQARRFIDIDDE